MTWYNNISLRWKISLPLALILLIFVASFVMTLSSQNKANAHSKYLSSTLISQLALVLEADRDLHQAFLQEKNAVYQGLTTAIDRERKENFEQARDRVNKAFNLGEQDADYSDFSQKIDAWQSASNKVVNTEDYTERLDLHRNQSEAAFAQARELLDSATEQYWRDVALSTAALEADLQQANLINWVLFLLLLVTLVAVLGLLPRAVQKPVSQILARINDITEGQGDLRPRLNLKRGDELGKLASHFDHLTDKLQHIVLDLKNCSGDVNAVANNLTQETTNTEQVLTNQRVAVRETHDSVNAMLNSLQSVSCNTQNTANLSYPKPSPILHNIALAGMNIKKQHASA